MKSNVSLVKLCVLCAILSVAYPTFSQGRDLQENATGTTKSANEKVLNELPFSNTTDFKNAHRGFIAPLPSAVIKGKDGSVIWNPEKYDFIKEDAKAPPTVNPSLWRNAKLITIGGLFKVTDGIYQVRNQDLSNMTIIEGDHGITIVDPLVSEQTAKAALDLYYQHRPKRPVVAVIYTHSHVDHYGGVRGVTTEAAVKSGKVKIYAPKGFMEAAVAENVFAGNAMSRRASYMYGNLLPADPEGQVGAGLGTTTSAGTVTLIQPTNYIAHTGEKVVIDGLTYVFLMAPGSEAPSEMLWYMPQKKAIEAAEDVTHTLHNTYSLRGAKIRDPLKWSKYINQALAMWGDKAEVIFAQHHWPSWGNENVQELLRKQRDMYRYINDQTLRLANEGYTAKQIADTVTLPKELATFWADRGYYGSMYHDVRATYVLYLGWFSGNPATLHPLGPVAASKKYVEYMGGADAVIKKAQKSYDKGEYRWVAEVMNHVVFADPSNQKAKDLEADALEQLGYQAESGPWRNFYLTGAQELRKGVLKAPTPNTASPDTVRAMTPDMLFDDMAIHVNGPKAANAHIVLNVDFTDTKQKYVLDLENGALSHTENHQNPNAHATIALARSTLDNIILKQTTLADALTSGAVKVSGDQSKFKRLLSYLDHFEFWFNIVTPNTND